MRGRCRLISVYDTCHVWKGLLVYLLAGQANRDSRFPWLQPAIIGTVMIAWPLLGMLFVIRRLAGELQPLAMAPLIVAGLFIAGIALVLHSALPARWSRTLPAITLALFAVALSIPGTHPVALTIFWLTLICEEVASASLLRRPLSANENANSTMETVVDEELDAESVSLLPPETSQQITRTRDETGNESLSCLLRVRFNSGEQTQTLHVAFCPSLVGEPEARCKYLEGAPCEIKLAMVESFGARLDVKRRGALQLVDEAIIELRVTASAAS